MNRNRLDRIGMRHYDDIRKSFTNLSSKGNLNRYYKAGIQ